jgi:hypothetical protein
MQNAKCKMQNAKCKMQNAKCKMQNAKVSLVALRTGVAWDGRCSTTERGRVFAFCILH